MAKYSVKIESYTDIDLVSNTLANTIGIEPQIIQSKIKYVPCMFGSTESYENAKIVADAVIEAGGTATVVISPDLNKSDEEDATQNNSLCNKPVSASKSNIKHCLSCGALIGIDNYACTRCGGTTFESYAAYVDNSTYYGRQNEKTFNRKSDREYRAVESKSNREHRVANKAFKFALFVLLPFACCLLITSFFEKNPSKEYQSTPTEQIISTKDNSTTKPTYTAPKSYSAKTTVIFTNKYGTANTKCAHAGCSNNIAHSGDTNCCTTHSNRCLSCNCYIDEDAMYCVDCIKKAASKSSSSYKSSSTHKCEECGKSASKSIIGLNGTPEYYCDEHYKKLAALMDMILNY